MDVAIISGSGGLVGSEAARFFAGGGRTVIGIDNDMRREFFGKGASTTWNLKLLKRDLRESYVHEQQDVRDADAIDRIFEKYGRSIEVVIHAAAQPSHDWAARAPVTDFSINAQGTLNLLEATRRRAPEASFLHLSTNKVYGDRPNELPLCELATRWEIEPEHTYANGIREDMSIDHTLHSLFGASKVAADVLVQEYGRYFGMYTACFRAGCITGPKHSGAELHGFLAYLMKCTVTDQPYQIFGYKAKQVRDNIHASDLTRAFSCFVNAPRVGSVYNIGGGRHSHCSMLEAIELCQKIAGRELQWSYSEQARTGDHIWWVTDTGKFEADYPDWSVRYDVDGILKEIYEANAARWQNEGH